MPPKVISSPWAKLVKPVVPKISDRPSAASAMISPYFRPDVDASMSLLAKDASLTTTAPIWNCTNFAAAILT